MPVMYAAAGNCHVYVHAEADLEMARRDRLQRQGATAPASATRPRPCWSTARSRAAFLPPVLADLAAAGVELLGDARGPRERRRGRRWARPRPRTGTPSTST